MTLDDDFYVNPGAEGVVLRDLDVKRFFVTSATNVYVVGGDIGPMHEGASAIKAESATSAKPRNVVVDGAYFHDYTRDPGGHVECLQAWSIDGFVLRNSVFTRCAVFNVFVAGLFQEVTNDAFIENNFFTTRRSPAAAASRSASQRPTRSSATTRSSGTCSSTPTTAATSAWWRTSAHWWMDSSVAYEYNVWQGAKCAPTDVNAASGFVRPQVGNIDLHLTSRSAAVGRGKLAPSGYGHRRAGSAVGGAPDGSERALKTP